MKRSSIFGNPNPAPHEPGLKSSVLSTVGLLTRAIHWESELKLPLYENFKCFWAIEIEFHLP